MKRVLVSLCVLLSLCVHGQNVIYNQENGIYRLMALTALSEDTFVFAEEMYGVGCCKFVKMNTDGEILESLTTEDLVSVRSIFPVEEGFWTIGSLSDSIAVIAFIDNDFNYTKKGEIIDDGSIKWSDFEIFRLEDGSFVFKYLAFTGLKVRRFDSQGNLLAERGFDDLHGIATYFFTPDENQEGFYLTYCVQNVGAKDIRFNCYHLDLDLNPTLHIEDVFKEFPIHSYPDYAYTTRNPFTGEILAAGKLVQPAYNGNPEIYFDVILAHFDSSMHYKGFVPGLVTRTDDQPASWKALDVYPDGSVVMCVLVGWTIGLWDIYIARYDANLEKLGEVYLHSDMNEYRPSFITALGDGSSALLAQELDRKTGKKSFSVLHIPVEAFLGVEEAHASGLRVAVAYPNPGGGEMRLRTTVEDAEGVVYDMNGRLVARQPLTQTETSFDATQWPSGTYLWNVTAHGKTVESGKWVKE